MSDVVKTQKDVDVPLGVVHDFLEVDALSLLATDKRLADGHEDNVVIKAGKGVN